MKCIKHNINKSMLWLFDSYINDLPLFELHDVTQLTACMRRDTINCFLISDFRMLLFN